MIGLGVAYFLTTLSMAFIPAIAKAMNRNAVAPAAFSRNTSAMNEPTAPMDQTHLFVGRQRELAQLDAFLDRALAGRGQVCFITGDAGAGKTTLALEFLRRAEARQADLVGAVALGDPQTGASDPYLIFREVLAQLTGDVEARLAQGAITEEGARRVQGALRKSLDCLLEFGPDLVGLLVPGAGVAVRLAKLGVETSKRAGLAEKLTQAPAAARPDVPGQKGLDQGQIFEQYAKVLNALAKHAPLLLILDDLQWADNASTDLLFHLARRTESSRIFIIALYRPAEIALGRGGERHPLERVMSEIKRYYGDVVIDLDEAGRSEAAEFIDALLDSEPNRLGPAFRRALVERTAGNPLFAVELLRALEEQGDLARDEQGRWVEGPGLDWSALPARAEGVIESRISRLTTDLLEALKLASVQGDAFTAEVVAQIRALNTRDFVRQLSSELEKRHRLVTAQGQQRVGEQRLSQYQFQNRLFQQYLYAGLDPTERAYLHEDIGRALETLYGERADEIAARLAWHFEQAGVAEKARHYLRRAGEQATARFAHVEAIDFFGRALALTPADAQAERFALLLGRARAYHLLGRRELQARDLDELEQLAAALADARCQLQADLERAYYAEATHDYAAARAAAERAIAAAQAAGDAEGEMAARVQLAWVFYRQAEYAAALEQAQQVLTAARASGSRPLQAESLRLIGLCHQEKGSLAQGRSFLEQALPIYRELGDRRGEGKVASNLAVNLRGENRFAEARQWYDTALARMREVGDRRNEAMILNNLGVLAISIGDVAAGRDSYEQSAVIAREVGERMSLGAAWVNLSTICRMQEDYAQALAYAQQALEVFETIGTHYGAGHAWIRIGHAQVGLARLEDAIAAYGNALTVRRETGTQMPVLETLAGLARAHLRQGNAAQALADLDEVLAHTATGQNFDGAEEPQWIYLICYEVLRANNDPRADDLLAEGYRQLQEKAARFSDAHSRYLFLANIPHHREIVKAVTGAYPAAPAAEPAAVAQEGRPQGSPVQAAAAAQEARSQDGRLQELLSPAPPAPAARERRQEEQPPAPMRPGRGVWGRRGLALAIGAAALLALVAALVLLPRYLASRPLRCLPACAGAELAGRDLAGERLVGADLRAANLYAGRLAGADLSASVFVSATLAAADLSRASLAGADLRAANLRGANLAGADLTSADLRGALLIGADLANANLTDADLAGANLAAAHLDGVTLTDARYDASTRWPHGFAPPKAN